MASNTTMDRTPEHLLSAAGIQALQESAWAETWEWIRSRSAFYRSHFQRAGFSDTDRPGLTELSRIPPVDKEMLSRDAGAFRCVSSDEVAEWVTTSGSMGEPLDYPMTERDLERLGRNEELSFRCAGLSGRETVLIAVTLDRCFIAGMAYYLGLRRLGCSVIRAGPAAPGLHLELMQRMQPAVVVGVPSFLCRIAELASRRGQFLTRASVRKAVCIGETIREPDGGLNRAGARIEAEWGAHLHSTYGITELAASLCECETGCGGHLHPELLHLEALDEDGRPVPNGEVGELTATTFGVEAMPLVRYRTGDCAALYREPCRCGRQTMRVGPILGRKGHKLKLKGTTVFPSALKRVLDHTDEVASYVIVARRGEDLSDRVEVRLACQADPGRVLRQLRERFQGEVRVIPELVTASVESIEEMQMPGDSRKRRWFVDLRAES